MEFEISHDPKEIVQKLDLFQTDLTSHGLLVDTDAAASSSYESLQPILNQKEFSSLKDELLCCVREYNKRYSIHKKDITFDNSWFNVMPKGSRLYFHIHNGSLFTGTYYPLLPEDATDLVIIDPEQRVRSPVTPCKSIGLLVEKSNKSKDDNRERKSIHIKEGHAYIFPSWLEHGTLNNNCDKRISISFNISEDVKLETKEYVGEELEKFMAMYEKESRKTKK
jgi:uncharacterized protein (TIGR02466 family)